MAAFSLDQSSRLAASALTFLVLGAACAEGTEASSLSPGVLDGSGSGGAPPAAAGMSSNSAGETSMGGMSSAGASSGMPGVAGTTAGTATGGAGGTLNGDGGMGGSLGGAGMAGGGVANGGKGGMAGTGGMGGMGGAAGMGGMAGMAGTGGTAPTGYRYARLVALSEQAGAVWSSVAELQLLTTANAQIPRTNWKVTADSEETDDQQAPASYAIDGDTATFWHTSWEPPPNDGMDAKLPHMLSVDLGTPRVITGFSYLPRQNNSNGRIKGWEFYLSKDGVDWGTVVKAGTFPSGTALQTVTF